MSKLFSYKTRKRKFLFCLKKRILPSLKKHFHHLVYKVIPRINKRTWLLILILLQCVIFLILHKYFIVAIKPPKAISYYVNTENCKIIRMDHFYRSVEHHITFTNYFNCGNYKPLVKQNDTHLFINEEVFSYYDIDSKDDVHCKYNYFWRLPPNAFQDDKNVAYSIRFNFTKRGTAKIDKKTHDFVRAVCIYKRKKVYHVYKDYFAFVHLPKENKKRILNKTSRYNVVIFGLDAVSHHNFHRQMPETFKYIKEKLNAVELFGYTKLGYNTFPNLMPVLTGLNEKELKKSCWPDSDARFDNCNFIWKKYHKAGYYTAFAEECHWCGLFNYLKKGFYHQPVHHMWGTFEHNAIRELGKYGRYENIAKCIGKKLSYMRLLEYAERFIRVYESASRNYFGTFWESSITHDRYIYGPAFDKNFKDFFASLHSKGYLNNTMVFFMGDHGYNMGNYTFPPYSWESRQEDKMPMFFIILPSNFRKKHPQAFFNLKTNSRKLTSHWDLHEALKAIVENDFSDDFVLKRGISFFKPIPNNRSCESAEIPPHWCPCNQNRFISVNHPAILLAAEFAIQEINNLVKNYSQCIQLTLDYILYALASVDFHTNHSSPRLHYLTFVFQTRFSNGIFDATIACRSCDSLNDFILPSPINRLSRFKDQAYCIKNYELQQYCYCTPTSVPATPNSKYIIRFTTHHDSKGNLGKKFKAKHKKQKRFSSKNDY